MCSCVGYEKWFKTALHAHNSFCLFSSMSWYSKRGKLFGHRYVQNRTLSWLSTLLLQSSDMRILWSLLQLSKQIVDCDFIPILLSFILTFYILDNIIESTWKQCRLKYRLLMLNVLLSVQLLHLAATVSVLFTALYQNNPCQLCLQLRYSHSFFYAIDFFIFIFFLLFFFIQTRILTRRLQRLRLCRL